MPRQNDVETSVELVDPLVGTIFDKRFRVEERIAAGGFGAIYRATHVKSGHPIALKVLLPSLAQDLGVVARFRREGDTLTTLRNPHTISAYELGQTADRTLFIVMELLYGESLFERYKANGPFEWKRMVKIALQVCESLEEAHGLGIVHRDLKPTNIHLEQHDGDPDYVKVLDFGIAKILRGSDFAEADITNAGQMIGTIDYMSPEQMVGGKVTGQTDIYTLGIVMYEMIAGCPPFPEAMTAAQALAAVMKTKPEALFLRAPVPEELDRIVMKCLEREMQKRYKTVAELRADLLRLLAGVAHDRARAVETKPVAKVELANTPPAQRQPVHEAIEETPPPPESLLADMRRTKRPSVEQTTFTPPPQQLLADMMQADEATSFTPPPARLVQQSRRDSNLQYDDEATSFTPPPQQLIEQSRRPRRPSGEPTSFAPVPDNLLAESRRARRPSAEQTSFTPPPQQILDDLRTPRRKQSPVVEWTDDDEYAPTTTRRPDSAPPPRGEYEPGDRANTLGTSGRTPTIARADDRAATVAVPDALDRAATLDQNPGDRAATVARGDASTRRPPSGRPASSRGDDPLDASTPKLERASSSPADSDVDVATPPLARNQPSARKPTTAPPPIPAEASSRPRSSPPIADTSSRPGSRMSPPISAEASSRPRSSPPIADTSSRPGSRTSPPPNALVPPRNAVAPITPVPRPLPRQAETPIPQLVAAPFSSNRPAPSNPAIPPSTHGPRSPQPPSSQIPTPLPVTAATAADLMRGPSNPSLPGPAAPMVPTPLPHAPPHMLAQSAAPHVPHGPLPHMPSGLPPHAPLPHMPTPGGLPPHAPLPHMPTPGGMAPYGGPLPHMPTPGGMAPYGGPLPYGMMPPPSPTARFDMARIAAREAMIRKLVWIIVIVVCAGAGVFLATQL